MADERKTYAAMLTADQIGKTVTGTNKYGRPFSGVVESVTHLAESKFVDAVTGLKLAGATDPVVLTGREEVTVS
jgi:hypothetical protein